MDGQRFDHLTRALAAGGSRRRVLKGLAAAAAALIGTRGSRRAAAQTCSGYGRVCASTRCCSTPGATCTCYPNGQCRCICPQGSSLAAGQCVCSATGEAPCGTACCAAGTFCLDAATGTCQAIGASCLTYSLSGDATPTTGGVLIRSDADPGTGGVAFNLPAGTTFADISSLLTSYTFEADDTCTNGSPRFQLATASGNIFVSIGPSPSFTVCTTGSEDAVGNNDACRFDTSQLAPGTQCNTYAGTLAAFGAVAITGIELLVDAGYAFSDGEQAVVVDPCVQVTAGA